jgi:hypothetical protein
MSDTESISGTRPGGGCKKMSKDSSETHTVQAGAAWITITIEAESPIVRASVRGLIQGAVERYRQSLPQVIQEKQSGCRGCGDK